MGNCLSNNANKGQDSAIASKPIEFASASPAAAVPDAAGKVTKVVSSAANEAADKTKDALKTASQVAGQASAQVTSAADAVTGAVTNAVTSPKGAAVAGATAADPASTAASAPELRPGAEAAADGAKAAKDAVVSPDAVEVAVPKEHVLGEKEVAVADKFVEANPEGGAMDAKDVPEELIGNLLDPENGPAKGLAYQVHYLGPPRPPCEDVRLATTCALGKIDGSEDPEIANILRVVAGLFGAPVSLCALFDQKRVFISDAEGSVVPRGEFPWRWTLCGWSLAFTSPMILVIPDTHEDARFRDNHKVTKEPNLRFYCGAPLIASNGHRLGTLCFVDVKPRVMDATSCMIMNNFSELVVRQLEKDKVLEKAKKDLKQLEATYGRLERSIDSFDHCVVLLDTNEDGWKLVFANAAFNTITGVDREKVVGNTLTNLFEGLSGEALPNVSQQKAAANAESFQMAGIRIKMSHSGSSETFVLRFRPAGKEFLDESTMPIGVPAFLPTSGGMFTQNRFYFMTVDTAASLGGSIRTDSSMTSFSSLSSVMSKPENLDGLEMGHLLGKGSFGSVYYGTWFGTPVAVKVIEADVRAKAALDGASLEAILSTNLRHPLIVSTLKYSVKQVKGPSSEMETYQSSTNPGASLNSSNPSGGWGVMHFEPGAAVCDGSASMPNFEGADNTLGSTVSSAAGTTSQTWMIMEYCDKGSLQDAIDRGWLLASRSCLSGAVNMSAVIPTALELASALNFLHQKGVVHGDLSGWNCMLSSAGSTASVGGRNFVAKIADFGLSRTMDIQSKIQTRNYGTLTHMPPETLISGTISKATDVYSFGVLMWQMFTGSRPWSGLSHAMIIMKVGTEGAKLVWPQSTPGAYRDLAQACMATKPEDRPTFDSIVSQLEAMQKREQTAEVADL